ncbi:type A2 lantipeptide [Streptomyces sp. NPDC005047]|uniref:type A2 lantipeptide n=1 Tax=Streptomyces sp. NPDC047065 TaxID=3154606 RepID=UPI00340EDB60
MQNVPSAVETREIDEAELDGIAGGLDVGGINLAPMTGLDLGGITAPVTAPVDASLGNIVAGL